MSTVAAAPQGAPVQQVAAAQLAAPVWWRLRFWIAVLVVVLVGAVLVGTLSDGPQRPLDPGSARPEGSKALVRVLAGYGTTVRATTRLPGGGATVLVTSPDDYSNAQLQALSARSQRLVLVRPGTRATAALLPRVSPDPAAEGDDGPGCSAAGALAAGAIELPGDTVPYRRGGSDIVSCYGGAVLVSDRLVIIGSATLLQNDSLSKHGVAALDVNLISANRTTRTVVWLQPGADAHGSGPASLWDLFPGGAHRAFLWLIALGVLVVLWRARRLGSVVREPLPVVVRSVELVEGHGRLYARAGSRERAADVLRRAALTRLAARLSLPRGASPDQVAIAAAGLTRQAPGQPAALLSGAPPTDDAGLVRLAVELDRLEAAVGGDPDDNRKESLDRG